MVYDAIFEESERADSFGAVNDLVGDDEISGLDLLLQATNSRESDDGSYANGAEGGNIGTSGHLVWSIFVVEAMTSEEGYGYWFACGG